MTHGPIQNSEVYLCSASAPPTPEEISMARPMSPISDTLCLTPPLFEQPFSPADNTSLATAVHVLQTEATALSCLSRLYETDPVARSGFVQASNSVNRSILDRGKLVICGVGKSGKIGEKLVATMNSLGILTSFLHPTEALHGDLGLVRPEDTILLITFSGRTPELLQLIPHFDRSIPLIVLTSHTHPSTCAITNVRPDTILLPAPIQESEVLSFGVSAPTTSTTIALALGDALAVAISRQLHASPKDVFLRNHPGGAIGDSAAGKKDAAKRMVDIAVSLSGIPSVSEKALGMAPAGVHVMMAAVQGNSGWVRHQASNGDENEESVAPPQRIRRLRATEMDYVAAHVEGLLVPRDDWVAVPGNMEVKAVARWLRDMRRSTGGASAATYRDDAVLSVLVDGVPVGVLEIGTVLEMA